MLGQFYSRMIVRYGDSRATLKGELAEKGYVVIHNYFNEADLARFPEVSASLEGSKESVDLLKKFPFLSKPLFDEKIISIVRDYLGPQAVLDYCSGRRFLASGPKSDDWHHDSVGHRIKIFMCISDQNETTHTEIVPSSHLIKYTNYYSSRLSKDEIERRYGILKVIGKKNDLIIFDTNLMHRGVYSDSPREIVQFEFSDIRKSLMKGHIGPRKSIFDKSIANSPLVATNKLRFNEETAYYK